MVRVSEDFDCEIILQMSSNLPFIQTVTVKFKISIKQFCVSSIYRPLKANLELLIRSLGMHSHLRILKTVTKKCGEFNLKTMNMTEASSNSSVFSQKYVNTSAFASDFETNAHICVFMLSH